jgi:hypothetical protein
MKPSNKTPVIKHMRYDPNNSIDEASQTAIETQKKMIGVLMSP